MLSPLGVKTSGAKINRAGLTFIVVAIWALHPFLSMTVNDTSVVVEVISEGLAQSAQLNSWLLMH